MKSLAWFIFIVLATVAGVTVIWQLRIGLWLLILSLAITAAFKTLIHRLVAQGISLKIALSITYTLVLGIIVLFLAYISNILVVEIQMLTNEFAINYQHIRVVWAEGDAAQRFIARQLPSWDYFSQLSGESQLGMLRTLLGVTSNFFESIGIILLALVISIRWTADHARFEQLWLSLVPVEQRTNALAVWRDIEGNIGAYLRSEMAQAFLTGLSLYIGYSLLGLNYPALLVVGGTVARFIPVMGPFLALIPVIILGFIQGWGIGVGSVLFTVVVFFIMGWLVEPRFFNRQRFSGLLLLPILMVCADLFGFIGLILAPPLSVAIQIFFSHLIYQRASVASVKAQPDLQNVQQRLVTLQTTIAAQQNEPSPSVVNLVERLHAMVERVQQASAPEVAAE